MISCFTCVPNTPQKVEKSSGFDKQGTKKVLMSANGATVSQEVLEPKGEGFLELKTGSAVYTWKKIKVSIEDTHILVYEKKNSEPTKVLPLQLCNVRPVSRRRFRVLCAPNILLKFRATDNDSLREWVNLIQSGIMRRLGAQTENSKATSAKSSGIELLDALRKAHSSNKFCADCHAADPKWISVSIGCIICIECSGVHRHLGSTISKIRSFELDMWTNKTEMVEKIGNADVNSVYEANIPSGHRKPHAFSDREDREKFIYNKYVNKLYRRKLCVPPRPIIGGASNFSGYTYANTYNTLSSSDPGAFNALQQKKSVHINGNVPSHKRSSSKPPIHIGSDLFATQGGMKVEMFGRRGSVLFDTGRRGSLGSTGAKMRKPSMVDQRRHSIHPTLA